MDLSVTNAWLAVAAISLLVIALAFVAAVFVLIRAARDIGDATARTTAAIEQVSRHVSPLAAQTSAFLGDVERTADRWRHVTTLARARLWPAVAAARGAAALVRWLAGGESSRRRSTSSRSDTDAADTAAEAQFTYEG